MMSLGRTAIGVGLGAEGVGMLNSAVGDVEENVEPPRGIVIGAARFFMVPCPVDAESRDVAVPCGED